MAPVDFDIASFVHEKAKQKGLELLLNVGVEKFNDKGETIEVSSTMELL
jgi:hypothetical protein